MKYAGKTPQELATDIRSGHRATLGRAITLLESRNPEHHVIARALLRELLPQTNTAKRIGISGVPGAGKSTFIDAFGMMLVEQGLRVAVLAVDPTSGVSGGSILGDKTRMEHLSVAPGTFIRPSPAGETLGGVAQKTREAMVVCEAAGYDVIIVETVGVGQSETVVAQMVDTFVLLALTGAGDDLQGIKRGILEVADIIAVNKADGDNEQPVQYKVRELKNALMILRGHATWPVKILPTSGQTGLGLDQVWELINQHIAHFGADGLAAKRGDQNVQWMWSLIEEGFRDRLRAEQHESAVTATTASVRAGGEQPLDGAERLLKLALTP